MLTFAIKDGRMIGIGDIAPDEWGVSCGCFCPNSACGEPLIAKSREFPSRKQVKYFAHQSGAECASAAESAIHRLGKQIIADEGYAIAPPVALAPPMPNWKTSTILPGGRLEFEHVKVEQRVDGLRPDLIGMIGQQRYMIEIRCTHAVDDQKREHARQNNWTMLEIDLSDLASTDGYTEENVRTRLLADHSHSVWIQHAEGGRYQARIDLYVEELSRSTGAVCPRGLGPVPSTSEGSFIYSFPPTQDAPCKDCPCLAGFTNDGLRCLGTSGIDSIDTLRRELHGELADEPKFFEQCRERHAERERIRTENLARREAMDQQRRAENLAQSEDLARSSDAFRTGFRPGAGSRPIEPLVLDKALSELSALILRYYKNEDGRPPLRYYVYLLSERPATTPPWKHYGVFRVGPDIFTEISPARVRPTPFDAVGFLFPIAGGVAVILDPPDGPRHEKFLCPL
jgi:hypothetical protein